MNVIDALGRDTDLYRAYHLTTIQGGLADYPGDEPAQQELWLKRYENFRLGRQRAGQTVPAVSLRSFGFLRPGPDHSMLKCNIRPLLFKLMGIEDQPDKRTHIEGQSIIFPAVRDFDVRMLPGGFPPAIVITEGALDLVHFYANAVSVCRALNARTLAKPPTFAPRRATALGFEPWHAEGASGTRLLEWAAFDPQARSTVIETVRNLAATPGSIRNGLSGQGKTDPARLLAIAILEIAMNLVAAYIRQPFRLPRTVNYGRYADGTDYLSALIVAFMVLHEVAHVGLRHGQEQSYPAFLRSQFDLPEGSGDEGESSFTDQVLEDGRVARVFFGGNTDTAEVQADFAACKWTGEDYREPLLAAATIWLAALEVPYVEATGRAQDLRDLGRTSSYPSFELRLKNMNKVFGTAARKKGLATVFPSIAARTRSCARIGLAAVLSDTERDRDVKLFEMLTDNLH